MNNKINLNKKKNTHAEKKLFFGCKQNLFTLATKFLVIILPFYVLIKVFFEHKLGIKGFGLFIKEFIIIILFVCLAFEYYKKRKIPKFDLIDYMIFSYIGYGIIITFINGLGLNSIIYGGRYDFIFFVVFLIFRHSKPFLEIKTKKLILLFIYSASISLLFSILIKFRIGEDSLIIFGFTDYVSDWIFRGGIPTYHGLENSGIKRFQGILDSPNNMGFFLILYTYLLVYLQKKKDELYVIIIFVIFLLLLILTYSRSSLLGVFSSIGLLCLLNIKYLYKKYLGASGRYKKLLIIIIITGFLFTGLSGILFQEKLKNVILRTSSTTGHFNRMKIGINRFLSKPLGSGLAESGPAYRSIYKDKMTKKDEQYYIPESWFVQQLTEGGIIYFSLFLYIFYLILKLLYKKSKIIFALLLSILVMNLFLHVFEATYLSVLLFIFIGLFTSKD